MSLCNKLIPDDVDTVAIGPIVWAPSPKGKEWYFLLASSPKGAGKLVFRGDRELAINTRESLLAELAFRRAIVIFDTDDELAFARFCAAKWPEAGYRRVVESILAEQSGGRH